MMDNAVISWITQSEISTKQKAAQIIVANNPDMSDIIYDSGLDENLSNLGTQLPITLKPRTKYYWTVKIVGDKKDEAVSDINWFESGKHGEQWQAEWITPAFDNKQLHPLLRKEFNISRKIKSARAYIVGMGLYELYINGKKVGNEYLTPGCTAADLWVQSQTYDITNCLLTGENAIGVMLGNGWAKSWEDRCFGTFPGTNTPYTDEFSLRAELYITLEDGNEIFIGTDTDWKCSHSPVLSSSIYDGEKYDAAKEQTDWNQPNFNDISWQHVKKYNAVEIGSIEDRLSLPIVIKKIMKPIELIKTPASETVLDMGQNMTGWLRMHINEPAGTKIKISYFEILQDGNYYRDNLRTAKQEYIYISDGKERIVEPHFTFYGFRYAKLEGFLGEINLDDFTGCVLYSDLEETGEIITSDPLVNKLFSNAKWGQRGNFLDVPTDCPQRDERMGWTGDTQVFCKTASYNMDTYAFYTKFLYDLWKEQEVSDGKVGNVVPSFIKEKHAVSTPQSGGSAVWGDAATIIPWTIFKHYGDITIIKKQYQSMKNWVDYIRRQDSGTGNHRLWKNGHQWGDWLSLDASHKDKLDGGTDKVFIASVYYMHSAQLVSKAAALLDNQADEDFYHKLADEIKQAVHDEFITKNGNLTIKTQTAHVLALQFDLVPEDAKQKVLENLIGLLKDNNMHLTTGFVGTPFLCRVLSEYGISKAAYQIFLSTDYPSWLYAVKMGATTIWERWNSVGVDGKLSDTGMNSLNHYAYGSIVEWMYGNMCGIKTDNDYPGFKKFIIKPELNKSLSYAQARYNSPMGLIESEWRRGDDGYLDMKVTVPFDSEAVIFLPDADLSILLESARYDAVQAGSHVKITLCAGTYTFRYMLNKNYSLVYSINNTINEMYENEKAKKIIDVALVAIKNIHPQLQPEPDSTFEAFLNKIDNINKALGDMVRRAVKIEVLNAELNRILIIK